MTTDGPRRVFTEDPPRTHDVRYGLVFLIGLVSLAAALYAIGHFVAGDKLPFNTTIAGVDVGGMTRGEASTALQEELAPRITQKLTVQVAGRTYSLDPQRSGLAYDIDRSIDDGMSGSSWDPRHMLRVLLGGRELEPALAIDSAELHATVWRIAADVGREPQDANVSFETGGPQVTFGRTGRRLDPAQARNQLISAVQTGSRRVTLAVEPVDPDVTDDEAATFASTVGTRAVSGPITLRVAGSELALEPRVFASSLTTEVVDSDLRLAVDQDRLYDRSRATLAALPHAPVDARIDFGRTGPTVVPSSNGSTVSAPDWADAVLLAVSRDSRSAHAAPSPSAPGFTTRDARKLGVSDRISSYSVELPTGQYDDLASVARQLDGTVLEPGDTMSFLGQVDTGSNEEAASLVAGATFTAAFEAGVTVLERTPDRYYSGTFPAGLDVRVAPPSHDLVLRNDSPYGLVFSASARRLSGGVGQVEVVLWSSPYWDVTVSTSPRHSVVQPRTKSSAARNCEPRSGVVGFTVEVTRTYRREGKRVDSDVTTTTYRPLDTVKCVRPPAR